MIGKASFSQNSLKGCLKWTDIGMSKLQGFVHGEAVEGVALLTVEFFFVSENYPTYRSFLPKIEIDFGI